jgi:hypothetical protein
MILKDFIQQKLYHENCSKLSDKMKYFLSSGLVILVGLNLSWWWGGLSALSLTVLLSVLEIALSFDNAILNVSVLQKMSPLWQKRFYTWGIFFAVFFTRLIFPLLIVAITTHLHLWEVIQLAIKSPQEYSRHLSNAHVSFSIFGGLFLWQVFCAFFFNPSKKIHWFSKIEIMLQEIGKRKISLFLFPIGLLLVLEYFMPRDQQKAVLLSGIAAISLFALLHFLTNFLQQKKEKAVATGIVPFLYLEVLDTSFSLDGVISAFAITTDLVILCIGLSIGAIFVRSITLFLAERGVMKQFIYLEHGAYYAIGLLGLIMLGKHFIAVPGFLTGLSCFVLLAASLVSSIRYDRSR